MSPQAGEAVVKTLYSGMIGQASKVDEFEDKLKAYLKNKHVLTVNSATSGEHLALQLLSKPKQFIDQFDALGARISDWPGLLPGDTVLTSPLTCLASHTPIVLGGYKIRWVDIDTQTLNMDLDDLEKKISPQTKAIMLPLWGGMPVDFVKLLEIQSRANLKYGFRPAVIIDAAHALGSTYQGFHVCNFGHITSYSFQAIKHISCGDGGALVLPHEDLYKRGKLLRWYGLDRDNRAEDFRAEKDTVEVGSKWHMNDIAATIGIANIDHAGVIIQAHKNNALYYHNALHGIPGVQRLKFHNQSSYWIYTILVERRSDFYKYMKENGIAVSRVHERQDNHTAFREFKERLPALDSIQDKYICIPVHWGVSEQDREFIVSKIKQGW